MANYYSKQDKTEFFKSPNWIKDICYNMIPNARTILDPCAGDCALEDFNNPNLEYALLDLNPRSENIIQTDFLTWTSNAKFDAAIVNPPFGLKNEFIKHLFNFTNEIVLIAPLKSVINDWHDYIADIYIDWKLPYFGFGILTSVAIFHLRSPQIYQTKEYIENKFLLPRCHGIDTICSFTNEHIKQLPGLYVPITKANIVRNNELFRNEYVFDIGDDSIFYAKKSSINNTIGDRISRNIIYTQTKEDAYQIIEIYKQYDDYIRNYAYIYGNNILNMKYIPLLNSVKNIVLRNQKPIIGLF